MNKKMWALIGIIFFSICGTLSYGKLGELVFFSALMVLLELYVLFQKN